MTKILFKKITIIGIGLIGSSFALAVKKNHLADTINAYDTSKKNLIDAKKLGIVDATYENIVDAVKDADLVVLATPVGTFSDIVKRIDAHLKSGCVLLDTGSVKQYCIKSITENLKNKNVIYVGGHPIAGTEKSGPTNAFSELFIDRWFIIVKPDNVVIPQVVINKISQLWTSIGSKVKIMDGVTHDHIFAAISHLPHALAFAIVDTVYNLERKEKYDILKYAAGGFRDFTRIAASDPAMWSDVFINNKKQISNLIDAYVKNLQQLKTDILRSDRAKLYQTIERVQKIKNGIITRNQYEAEEQKVLHKHLLVGVPGDYMPMAYFSQNKYVGLDIDIINLFAKQHNMTVEFVKTSWSTLDQDILANKFHIAIGGISRTKQRMNLGLISSGYWEFGKTILCRKIDKNKFKNIADINKKNVKVMCNPGGTNQIFVNQRLPHANIAINEFNNQIPSCVAKGIADVMITDDIEAKYYVAQDKTLCVQEIRFLKSQKCFYFNKSEKLLKTAVDKFLRIILADKTISKLMNKYIA